MLKWKIGGVTVTRILEMEGYTDVAHMFVGATAEEMRKISWIAPHFADEQGQYRGSSHALIIEASGRRILVDTCHGNDKQRKFAAISNLQTDFLERMIGAGFAPNSFDAILCTHLHFDHVGWNTMLVDGAWRPTFPNARYLFAKSEYEYWMTHEEGPTDKAVFEDSIRPIVEANLVDLVEPPVQVCDEVRLISTPGHSPGHVSVAISSQGQEALITGDFIHNPCQCARPDWSSHFDHDAALTRSTRERMLAELAETPTLVIGSHFPSPTAGRVVRDGAVYRFEV